MFAMFDITPLEDEHAAMDDIVKTIKMIK